MPIYEYRCPEGHTFELFQRMSDPPPDACAVCAAAPVEKVLFPVAVHYKGSGFYSTDYGRGARKKESSGDSGDAGGGSGGSGAEVGKKTETKSDSAPKAAEA